MVIRLKRTRNYLRGFPLRVEPLEDRTLLNATLFAQITAPKSLNLSTLELSAELPTKTMPVVAAPSDASESIAPSVGRSLVRTAGFSLTSDSTTSPVEPSLAAVSLTTEPETTSLVSNPAPASDISNGVESVTPLPNEPLGREVVGGIHARHPDWQVDTAWVSSGDFTVSSFLDWHADQSDPPSNASDRPGAEAPPTIDNHLKPGTSVVTPSASSDGAGVQTDVNVSPTTDHKPTSSAHRNAVEVEVAAPDTSGAFDHSPEVMNAVPIIASRSEAWVGLTGADSGLSPQFHANRDGILEASVLTVRSGHGGLGNFEVAVHAPAETPAHEFVEVALVLENVASLATDDVGDQTRGFVPHSVGLHTSLSAFDAPVIDLGAFGEQITELVRSITESDTNMLLVSCFVAVVAAGVGCEIIRRHYRRVTPQLATATAGRLPEDWLLG